LIPVTKTRGHSYRLFVNLSSNDTRKKLFAHLVVKCWNSLPVEVVFSTVSHFPQTVTMVDFSEFLTVD